MTQSIAFEKSVKKSEIFFKKSRSEIVAHKAVVFIQNYYKSLTCSGINFLYAVGKREVVSKYDIGKLLSKFLY